MKIIIENKYVKTYSFIIKEEFDTFFHNQNIDKKLKLEEQGGELWHCYIFFDSLTSEKLFVIGLNSDRSTEDLNILFWSNANLTILDNGNCIFFINDIGNVIANIPIITPLIGFHITPFNVLLVLEEATMKLISSGGKILKKEQFDLLNDFYIENNQLCIMVNNIDKVISLCP